MFIKSPIYLPANSLTLPNFSISISKPEAVTAPFQHSLCLTSTPVVLVLPGKRVRDVSLVGEEVSSTGYSIIRHRVRQHN